MCRHLRLFSCTWGHTSIMWLHSNHCNIESYRFVRANQLFDWFGAQELAAILRATITALSTRTKAFELIVECEFIFLGNVSYCKDTYSCLAINEPVQSSLALK